MSTGAGPTRPPSGLMQPSGYVVLLLVASIACFGVGAEEATTNPQYEIVRFNKHDNSSKPTSVETVNGQTTQNPYDTVPFKERTFHLNAREVDGSGLVQNDLAIHTQIRQQPKPNELSTSGVVTQISAPTSGIASSKKTFRTRSVSSEDSNSIFSSSGVLLSGSSNASSDGQDLVATKRHKGRKMHGARHSSKNPKIRPKNLLGLTKNEDIHPEDSSFLENGIMAVSPRRFHNKTGNGFDMEDDITIAFRQLNIQLITFNKTSSGVLPYAGVNASPRQRLLTTEIVPLNDVTNPYDGSKKDEMGKNRTSLPWDPKRPYFDLAPRVEELLRSNSSDEASGDQGGGEGAYGERDEGLYCYTCNSSTSSDYCYNMGDENGTLPGGGDYDIPPSRSCGSPSEGQFCMVTRVWVVTKDGANKTEHRFSIKRGCKAVCEPFYIMMGDRSKIEIMASRTCCTTPNCNTGNTASRTCRRSPLLLTVTALLLLSLHR